MKSNWVQVANPFSMSPEEIENLGHLYPEIAAAGRLESAIKQELATLGCPLRPEHEGEGSPFWAFFRERQRSVNICTAKENRIFISDFWSRGVELAGFATTDLREVVRAIKLWLADELTLRAMEQQVPGIRISGRAYEFEAGRGVDAQWNALLSLDFSRLPIPQLLYLLRAAAKQPLLRQLFPFLSMNKLCFSSATGYPYSRDLPMAEATGKGHAGSSADEIRKNPQYRALKADGSILGEGTPEEVIDIVVQSLPQGIGPAVDGTADDLVESK